MAKVAGIFRAIPCIHASLPLLCVIGGRGASIFTIIQIRRTGWTAWTEAQNNGLCGVRDRLACPAKLDALVIPDRELLASRRESCTRERQNRPPDYPKRRVALCHRFTPAKELTGKQSRSGRSAPEGFNMAWLTELKRAQQELSEHAADPLRAKVEVLMRGQTAMSTAALLDFLGLPPTTANGRLLAKTMRSLGFIPLKSRRLMPGGHQSTVTRGWSRPVTVDDDCKGKKVSPTQTQKTIENWHAAH